jgi:hypothetical protein
LKKRDPSTTPQSARSTRSLNLDEVLRSEFRAAYVVEERAEKRSTVVTMVVSHINKL